MLQWFEGTWQTIERRSPDVFMSGYGSLWTPPPSRAESGNTSVGYDVYDRFDLGATGNSTLYGTERSIKAMVAETHRWGGRIYSDLILNHNGFATRFNPGFTASGGYPGFAITRGDDIDGDFHQQNYTGSDPFLERISGLIDIAQEKNYQYIRNPVPGFAGNLPAGTSTFNGRTANIANESNRRFYPDQALGGTTYFDPTTGSNVTVYDFNTANPAAGDPVMENGQNYLMRHARWMVQEVGFDGFRLDAVKHFPPAVLNELDRQVWKSIKTPLLNGQQQHVFSFSEMFDGNRGAVQQYIKKNANTVSGTTIGGNRDALDFPLFFAMRDNLTANGLQNDWRNVVGRSQDVQDDGLENGTQGVAFAESHDEDGVTALKRVAHAYMLMRPGNALVYFNAKEFGNGRTFPKDGELSALGGFHGSRITDLVEIRNTHGRGNYTTRLLEKEVMAYERDRSALVVLNNRGDSPVQTRVIQTGFAPGTKLIDLTGNATNPAIDTTGALPDVVTIDALGRGTFSVAGNATAQGTLTDNGYAIYGLAKPTGTLSISNIAATLNPATPTAGNNATNRLTALPVITANAFSITLNTLPVTLPDGSRDTPADGDNALFKFNAGLNLNGNGGVDLADDPLTGVVYGFEQFVTQRQPGYNSNPALSGAGTYSQSIDTTLLPEGYNYITVRAFRQRSDGGPAVFEDFRQAIYVDRLAPIADHNSIVQTSASQYQFRQQSTDGTANRVHILLNFPGNQTEAAAIAQANVNVGLTARIDRDLFALTFGSTQLRSGNQVVTSVAFEETGNVGVKRTPGIFLLIPGRGLGLGDLDGSNSYTTADINGPQGIEFLTYPNSGGVTNHTFGLPGAPADIDGNGLLDTRDLLAIRAVLVAAGAPAAVLNEARAAELRRGNINNSPLSSPGDAADIDSLFSQLGSTSNIWRADLNVDNMVTVADVDLLLRNIFLTEYGDANLDRSINLDDFTALAAGFGSAGGWASGDFTGDGVVNLNDFTVLASNFGFVSTGDLPRSAVPEPSFGAALGAAAVGLLRRGRRCRNRPATPE